MLLPGKANVRMLCVLAVATLLLAGSQSAFSTSYQPTDAEAARFLEQSTFGPTTDLIAHVKAVGFDQFLYEQFTAPMTGYPDRELFPSTAPADCLAGTVCNRDNYTLYPVQNQFFVNALYGEDQLRQRVAFALHQIFVVSGVDISQSGRMTPYLQLLHRNALGNYRDLLYEITLNPAMGNYLDMAGNTKTAPNENYAREVLQLFSIGLYRLNPDGTRQVDQNGQPIPTYDQNVVNAFARVFTGWNFVPAAVAGVPDYIHPMVATESRHDTAAKVLLRNVTLKANQTSAKDLNDALDNIFNDPNVGPFISKQLIEHLVTSNPSPAYIQRVSTVFDNNGSGVRGDLQAVVRAILLDPEATTPSTSPIEGHLRHPILFVTGFLREFNPKSADFGGTSDGYLNPQIQPMGMDLFKPPSVFSYFPPTFGVAAPGGGAFNGPEFALYNTSTALTRANFINTMIYSRIAVSANAPNGTTIDGSWLLPYANDLDTLMDILNTLMMHGSMSSEMRQSIIAAVSPISKTNALRRVQNAVYLVATSSQYQVER
jgi:uncharacterized protein (DUF1800 family)